MAISFPIKLRSCPRPPCDPGKMRRLGIAAGIALLAAVGMQPASASSAGHKQQALEQFAAAEQMRAELDQQAPGDRTRKDYKRVAEAFRRVYYLAPTSSKADASAAAVADLLTLMGRQFQPGEKDLRAAIAHYEFLRREYPGSKYRMQALLNIGQIYQQDLRDDEAARHAFEQFLKQYPRNSLAPQARQALAELNAPKPEPPPVEAPVAAEKSDKTETAASGGFVPVFGKKLAELPVVTGVRHWSTPDYTRVAIDIDSEVKYEAGRVANPDRIFFDLPNTRLAAALAGKSFDVHDGFLKKIRAAQFQPGYTRVVLEVADVSDYSAFLLPNPYRLIIDIHGRQRPAETETATATNSPADGRATDASGSTHEKSYTSVQKAYEAATSGRS